MDPLIGKTVALAVVGFVIWGLLRAARPVPVFTVLLTRGEPDTARGTVTSSFLQRVREVAAEHGITAGRVCGMVRRGGRIGLTFSSHFPPAARQQLRNWWAVSGWSAPTRRN